jgi:hypothetical protein
LIFIITANGQAPGINKGAVTGVLKDLDDNNRNIGLPDLGCYEKTVIKFLIPEINKIVCYSLNK